MPITKPANSHANVKQVTSADSVASTQSLNRLIALYSAVVGSAAQVTSGVATHTSLSSAITYVNGLGGGAIYYLSGTVTENVNITVNSITVVGAGHTAILSGDLTVSGNYNEINGIKVTGNYTVSGNNNFNKAWIASTSTFTDSGLANDNRISQE